MSSRLKKALEDKIMDVRLRDKLIGQGELTSKQVDEYLKSLPDEAGNCRTGEN